jgi:hypothetical protein
VSADPSSARRLPVVAVLVVALVAGVIVQRHRDAAGQPPPAVQASDLLPVASPAALSSTWYCAAGSALGHKGPAEQTVIIENAGEHPVQGLVTAITDTGAKAHETVEVPARDHLAVQVQKLVTAKWAAVVVEVGGGEVAVSHVLTGPTGTAVASCSSGPSDHWYMPSGTTRPGTHQWLALFNPFPSPAIATVTFATSDGERTPPPWSQLVVPGGRVVVLPVDQVVTLRTQLATTVSIPSGRLVVDQLQSADGSSGTAKGLSVTPAAPRPTSTWWFADGPATPGARTSFVVQNPGSTPAKVSMQLRLDRAGENGTVSPFSATVAPGSYATIDVSGDPRVPQGVGYTAVVRAAAGQSVVASRVVTAVPPAQPSGFSVALGSPVLGRRWLLPVASSSQIQKATLIVTNPSSTHSVEVSIANVAGGGLSPLQGTESVELIPASGRAGFTIAAGSGAPTLSLVVDAKADVVVEIRLDYPGHGVSSALAVPVIES